jgi:MFS family permease
LRRVHLIIGVLGVIAFLLTGQAMKHHHPRLMFLSRHIYLLGASLVNVALGLYLHMHPRRWRRVLQGIGSLLIVLAPVSLLMAFLSEPGLGIAGRSWRSYFALLGLFAGVMTHIVASAGASRIDTTRQAP